DRNRIALSADLIGAAAFGICNLLPLTGDDAANGDQPDAKAVHDINSAELISLARNMSDKGVLPNGREIDKPPHFHIGCADVPQRIKKDDSYPALVKKIEAGAHFVQTQLCYDINLIEGYIADLGERGFLENVNVLIGLGPIASAKSALWMRENLWGVSVPDTVVQRLEESKDPKQEGRRIAIELIEAMQKIKGISGVHLMAPGQSLKAIAALLTELH
ncbi:MAG: methylenetetrahydrofolate reductase (NADPH), partial [Gammaproteobacteria bacterium]